MTISAYQIDNILKAYSRQSKAAPRADASPERPKPTPKYADVVSLTPEQTQQEAFDKISYSLMDVLLKADVAK